MVKSGAEIAGDKAVNAVNYVVGEGQENKAGKALDEGKDWVKEKTGMLEGQDKAS